MGSVQSLAYAFGLGFGSLTAVTANRRVRQTDRLSKPVATAVDGLAVGVSTALIVGMVGCLVFFLIVAFYRGEYDGRLMYIFGLYTLGTVMVARIAIESGRAYANAFSIPLAIVSIIAMIRFVTIQGPLGPISWLVNLGLLAVTWYLADRITHDCTFITDRQQSLQKGLLQSLGLLRADSTGQFQRAPVSPDSGPRKAFLENRVEATQTTKSKRRHNPGVWVLYFSLLAFPLFGLGQLIIPDEAQRSRAFYLLVGYLACGLSLLVFTSFAGMRRYLRQRGVEMPADMSRQWLLAGIGGVLVVLLVCMILPLPGRSLGLIGLPAQFTSPEGLVKSRFGWGQEGDEPSENFEAARADTDSGPPQGAPKPGAKGNPQPADNPPADAPKAGENGKDSGKSDTNAEPAPDTNEKPSEQSPQDNSKQDSAKQDDSPQAEPPPGDPQENNRDGDSKTDAAQGQNQPSSGSSNPVAKLIGSFAGNFGELFKWLTIAVLAAIVVLYAVTHPQEIAQLWRDVLRFFASLWGNQRALPVAASSESVAATSQKIRRPFSSFANPFTSQSNRNSPAQVIEYSFAALEAWAADRGMLRSEQQTASEFARQVGSAMPEVGGQAVAAANMLDQIMFAGWKPSLNELSPLEKLWQTLQRP